MLNHEAPPNWVKGRAECNLHMTFEVLMQIVERDVAEANKIFSDRQFTHELSCDGTRPIMYVSLVGDAGPGVRFELTDTCIRITGGGVHLVVRPHWDGKRCRLYVHPEEQRASAPWEISQQALNNMFFPVELPSGARG